MNEKLEKLCQQWERALLQEADYVQRFGAKRFVFLDAVRIEQTEESSIYEAVLASGMDRKSLPVSMPLEVEVDKKRYPGEVLVKEDDRIVLEIQQPLRLEIPIGEILVESSYLLKQLARRLEDVREDKKRLGRIHGVMKPKKKAKTKEHPTTSLHDIYYRTLKNSVTFVWGPPGTGKTFNLSRVIAQHYDKNKRILVLSHSNAAVDVLTEEVVSFLQNKKKWRDGDVLRVGQPITPFLLQHPTVTLRKFLLQTNPDLTTSSTSKNQYSKTKAKMNDLGREIQGTEETTSFSRWRKKEKEAIEDAKVVLTTISKASIDKKIYEKEFDLVVIDEASMVNIPQIAFAATLADKRLIAGDFKQLPPIAQSRGKLALKWLQRDIFHASGVADAYEKTNAHPQTVMLTEQRRMHQDISAFTNKHIYHGLVGDHPSVYAEERKILASAPFPGHASVFVNTTGFGDFTIRDSKGNSRVNVFHALLSLQLLLEVKQHGTKSIGVMTPYAAQAQLLQRLIQDFFPLLEEEHDIFSATVHQFQGEEKEVIIFDSVDSPPEYRPSMLLTKEEHERLLTVAFTRAKSKFILIGHGRFLTSKLQHTHLLHRWVKDQEEKRNVIRKEDIGRWVEKRDNRLLFFNGTTDKWKVDIQRATSTIIMGGSGSPPTFQVPSKVKKIWVGDASHDPSWEHHEKKVPFSFLLVDEKVLWIQIHVPTSTVKPFVTVRLHSPSAVSWLQNVLLA